MPLPTGPLTRIGFGSCLHQDHPQPIWAAVRARDPELFLMIGDNVYADAEDVVTLRDAYQRQADHPELAALLREVPVLAVWDDHDYGRNDAGAEYPLKAEAKAAMLDFFGEPVDSPRRRHDGVYDSIVIGSAPRRVQIILLDTRWFRSPLVPVAFARGRYVATDDPRATILGPVQWAWLAEQLDQPAELRVVVSSIQVLADQHPFETWGLFPHERARLFELFAGTGGVLVLSGDRHRGELSRAELPPLRHPLYDLTSSSLNLPLAGNDDNRFRVGPVVADANFGTLAIDWDRERVGLALVDVAGVEVVRHDLEFAELGVT